MRSTTLLAALMPAAQVLAAPSYQHDLPASYFKHFKNPVVKRSAGGKAICVTGTINIQATAMNIKFNVQQPTNNSVVTEMVQEVDQVGSTYVEDVTGPRVQVTSTFGIYSRLCVPAYTGKVDPNSIQFLIHGAGFDGTYWDPAPGYSYIDAAAEKGFTTFYYDRLGTGLSDHPDPIQIVQLPIQIAIAHELIQFIRAGNLATTKFKHVVGVGHSLGSAQTIGVAGAYPKDLDAIVLTGFSADGSGAPIAFAGVGLTIAAQADRKFAHLSNGYLTASTIQGNQFFFFRQPGFDPAILQLAEDTKGTVTVGEYLGLGVEPAASFTGPVQILNGQNDLPNCHGDCLYPNNKAKDAIKLFFPASAPESSWWLAPGTGHGINFHYQAPEAYRHMIHFIEKHGF
ncbi:alpha/beta-hydrolase [Eremomyces bilateralis CBS 781.70]|uniref:Alpha/beta-hydrolase n=1 Tax=Eremomyces bilateralis CBS 781.70 TaxID=1392243 RepID=A0A6G1GG53_9PEZI|nr:alpha/beta-hydrolase [Eremomyces bilateralis CBS 781.70]KAF1816972.1 alpha/beta-hydrolase [Eremomyces bilateralis CBS 781.70]